MIKRTTIVVAAVLLTAGALTTQALYALQPLGGR